MNRESVAETYYRLLVRYPLLSISANTLVFSIVGINFLHMLDLEI
jgi:hypothetical protein